MRKTLIYNNFFHSDRGQPYGHRTRLAWGKMDEGPAHSLGHWQAFQEMELSCQQSLLKNIRGAQTMVRDLKTGRCNFAPSVELYRWEGAFTRFGVCIGVRGLKRGSILVALENGHEGKLKIVDSLSETVNECAFEKIRLVGRQGKIWFH